MYAAFSAGAVFLLLCGYFGTTPLKAVSLLTIAVGFQGWALAGFNINHLDIAPRFSGVLMGMSNCVATLPGFLGPVVAKAITNRVSHNIYWEKRKREKKRQKKQKKCFRPGSNRGPCACEAHVITTTLRKLLNGGLINIILIHLYIIQPSAPNGSPAYYATYRDEWREVFLISAEIYVFGILTYLILGSGKKQPWADGSSSKANISKEESRSLSPELAS